MEVGINFKDIKSYTDNMSKGLNDKLFFLDKINFSDGRPYLFVDFGCADGTLLTALYSILNERGVHAYYIGYDISSTMINFARSKFNEPADNGEVTDNWDHVENAVKTYYNMTSVLILSSVIHEVYSYAKPDTNDIGEFWHRVRMTGFDYVCIRDMMCSEDVNRKPDAEMLRTVYENIGFATTFSRLCSDFKAKWGSISDNNKNLIHFLLKYRWQLNWDRELNEDYFPIYISDLFDRMQPYYNVSYFERFRVPFLDDCIRNDFGIELEDYTHIKAIFECKKKKEG